MPDVHRRRSFIAVFTKAGGWMDGYATLEMCSGLAQFHCGGRGGAPPLGTRQLESAHSIICVFDRGISVFCCFNRTDKCNKTVLLTLLRIILRGKMIVSQQVETFLVFCEMQKFITVFSTARHVNPIGAYKLYLLKIRFNIILLRMSRPPKSSLSLRCTD